MKHRRIKLSFPKSEFDDGDAQYYFLDLFWKHLDPHLHDCGDGRYMLQLSSENAMIALTEDDLQRLGIKDGGE